MLEENEMASRNELAREMAETCPPDSYPDYADIVEALKRGDSKEEMLFMPAAFRWPKTYKWLKERL